jgi:ABC-2 type transport system ATP-binding protein
MIKEPDMDAPFVELRGVCRSYGALEAIKDLNFTLEPGVSYGLIGRNGAGKSTMLRLIMGMLQPHKGTVRLFGGNPIDEAERVKLHVGYLAEDQIFPASLRPRDLYGFFSSCFSSWDWDFANSLIHRFHIPVDSEMKQMSKGQQRQASLVCAVAHRPKLLILDEPGGGLDPLMRRSFLEEVIDVLSNEGTSVLFSSHHLGEVERMATRVGILDRGSIILEGELDQLKEGSCRVIAEVAAMEADRIKSALPGCLKAKKCDDGWILTLLCTETEAKDRVRHHLEGRIKESKPLTLEDLFVSMVG